MQRIIKYVFVYFILWPGTVCGHASVDNAWGQTKGKHFVVFYEARSDEILAKDLLRYAESYYQKIGESIGYAHTNRMWTWEDRVQIFLFATQSSFLKNTGQPLWSTGYADRDSQVFNSKTIVSFRQEESFVDGLLPHEISHLILHDFIPDAARIPSWFDEGVAQMEEKDKRVMARTIMKAMIDRRQNIPFSQFVHMDIRKEKDPRKAQLFYAQSLSIIDYLVAKYGADAFGRLCRQLRDNKDFSVALSVSYPGVFKDFQDLERKWVLSFNQ